MIPEYIAVFVVCISRQNVYHRRCKRDGAEGISLGMTGMLEENMDLDASWHYMTAIDVRTCRSDLRGIVSVGGRYFAKVCDWTPSSGQTKDAGFEKCRTKVQQLVRRETSVRPLKARAPVDSSKVPGFRARLSPRMRHQRALTSLQITGFEMTLMQQLVAMMWSCIQLGQWLID